MSFSKKNLKFRSQYFVNCDEKPLIKSIYRLDGRKGAFSRGKGLCKGHEKRCKGHVQGPQKEVQGPQGF